MISFLGLPMLWIKQTHENMQSLGYSIEVTDDQNLSNTKNNDISNSGDSPLILSGKYDMNGFWPALSLPPASSRGRPKTGYEKGQPPVIDRIFGGPMAQGISEKQKQTIKESLSKTTPASVSNEQKDTGSRNTINQRAVSRSSESLKKSLKGSTLTSTAADAIFKEKTASMKKLSYAEKLQVMIMQVQDTSTNV